MNTAEAKTDERRELPRMQLGCPMVLEGLDGQGPWTGKALSVSGGGLRFETGAELSPGDRLEVMVTPPLALTGPLKATLMVLRVEAGENPRMPHHVAGRFEKIHT